MAKKKPVNKSQAIRDYLAQHPNARGVDVRDDLSVKGIDVSPQLVSAIKRENETVNFASREQLNGDGFEELIYAKKFTDAVGGVKQARELIDMVEKIDKRSH